MKRISVFVLIVLMIAVGAYVAIAQQRQGPAGGMMQRSGGMAGRQGMMGDMMQQGRGMMQQDQGMMQCPCSMMARGMNEQQMVATSDGVIVMAGGKLIKYNNNLEVVKEVEIPVDVEAMQKKMQKMMQSCPMHQQMMERMQGGADAMQQEGAPAGADRPMRQSQQRAGQETEGRRTR